MQRVIIRHKPPSRGWLPLQITVAGRSIEIDASDVPNNPVQDLIEAIDRAASGLESRVWWHLEPDGCFMYFTPVSNLVQFRLEFAPDSKRGASQTVFAIQGSRAEMLLPFWRFLREFQSHSYTEPDWPAVNYERILVIKEKIQAVQVG